LRLTSTFTGKSKKETFLSLYDGLIHDANKLFTGYALQDGFFSERFVTFKSGYIDTSEWLYGQNVTLNNALKKIFTPCNAYLSSNKLDISDEIQQISIVLNKLSSPITIDISNIYNNTKDRCTYLMCHLYDIHPFSVTVELYESYKEIYGDSDTPGYSDATSNVERKSNQFPKNKITNEMFAQSRLYKPRTFTSLESAEELFTKASEDAILGNNANYSFIANLGGSITEEEQNYSNIKKKEFLSDNIIQFNGIENLKSIVDQDNQKLRIDGLIEEWNALFTKAVLGGEGIN
jgi:hypothetical protein